MRSPAGPNVLAIESAMDRPARTAGADPLTYRLAQIGFLSALADQPHFTRSFIRAACTTPASCRVRFQVNVTGADREPALSDRRAAPQIPKPRGR